MASKYAITFIQLLIILALFHSHSEATPEYSNRSEQSCKVCHVGEMGGKLTETGLSFAASGYEWPPEGGYRVLGFIKKPVRFVIGLIHIVSAFLWFGTILYVHMLLKPAYAEKGLPKGEVRLGMISMSLVGITGILLTISRIKSIDVLFTSPWGIVLSTKIAIYIIMISSAAIIVFFIGPKLKEKLTSISKPPDGIYDPLSLSFFDGTNGRDSLLAYKNKVYDVSVLKLWKNGKHMRHSAGNDLTEALSNAPHGFEKLEALDVVGTYDSTKSPPKSIHQRIFYFVAYMNLILVYVVLLTISYWRWGI
ncbi:MAG: cytochrome B5 [Nitrospirota bacterium]|nr:MAG: cytochrome B5 [Nitrospirota bacterium]